MESRGRRPRSPERERPAARKVPVVYYLTRSRHLEHPHFVEVPVSSQEGLYLRGQWMHCCKWSNKTKGNANSSCIIYSYTFFNGDYFGVQM